MGLRSRARNVAQRLNRHAMAAWIHAAGPRPARTAHRLPGELIVSLTSYPRRYRHLHLTLICLLRQTVQADRIILWVGAEEFGALPEAVLRLQAKGIDIRQTRDVGPFTKVIPTLREFPDAFIVTADDDTYYPALWLAGLVNAYDAAYPQILCHRAHMPRFEPSGALAPYRSWEWERECTTDSGVIFPTGVGGVLYPPRLLPAQTLDEETFLSLCPRADDVWLYFMGRQAGARYRTVGAGFRLMDWAGTQDVGLSQTNVVQDANDSQIAALERHLGQLGPN